MKLICILTFCLVTNAFAAKQKLSKDSKEFYIRQKIEDYKTIMQDPNKVRVELVQYFGKRERNLVNALIKSMVKNSIAQAEYKRGEIEIKAAGKTLSLQFDKLLHQSFRLEDFSFNLKDYNSLENMMKQLTTKLNVFLNVSYPIPSFEIFPSAYAASFDVKTVAMSIITLSVVMIHGRSDTCDSALKLIEDEMKDFYVQCELEKKNFNTINLDSTTNLINSWSSLLDGFFIKTDKICEEVGAYFDNENSQSCKYKQVIGKADSAVCKQIYANSICVQELIQKIQQ